MATVAVQPHSGLKSQFEHTSRHRMSLKTSPDGLVLEGQLPEISGFAWYETRTFISIEDGTQIGVYVNRYMVNFPQIVQEGCVFFEAGSLSSQEALNNFYQTFYAV